MLGGNTRMLGNGVRSASLSLHSILDQLRALQPVNPVAATDSQLFAVCQRQADLLLQAFRVTRPATPSFVVGALPFLQVEHRTDWPVSGLCVFDGERWRIVLRSGEPITRQRFTLAHELKHIIDDPLVSSGIFGDSDTAAVTARLESLCDYFAACLLMPVTLLMRDMSRGWADDPGKLARRYGVSEVAMQKRLRWLGTNPTSSNPTNCRITVSDRPDSQGGTR